MTSQPFPTHPRHVYEGAWAPPSMCHHLPLRPSPDLFMKALGLGPQCGFASLFGSGWAYPARPGPTYKVLGLSLQCVFAASPAQPGLIHEGAWARPSMWLCPPLSGPARAKLARCLSSALKVASLPSLPSPGLFMKVPELGPQCRFVFISGPARAYL